MKAARLHKLGERLQVEDAPAPSAQPGEVLVRVEACGVCHSDLHMAKGDWPDVAAKMELPAILGHEVVGRVVEAGPEAGPDVPHAGERVGVGWLYSTCGRCEMCLAGAENVCYDRQITSLAAPGGFAEFIRVRASHAIPIPEPLSSAEAAPLFCAGLTVYHALRNTGVEAGQRVAILGVGGLGHLAVQLARHLGAEVVAADVSEAKLELARSLGAAETFDATAGGVAREIRAGGEPHVVVVTSAARESYDLALRVLRRRGTLTVVGLPKEDVAFNADNLVVKEHRIVGSAVGTRREMHELLALAAAGKVRCRVESYPLEEVNEVFDRMRRGALLGRAVLVP
jgi:propanol-preferring alcohol dehydrogenase